MAFFTQDFVDREGLLRLLREAVEQIKCRIALFQGRPGIGKSTLLKVFLDEARKDGAITALVDLQQPFRELNYLTVILEIQRQFGYAGFERLGRALKEARSDQELIQTLRASPDWEEKAPGAAQNAPDSSGGITIQGPVEAPYGQFAQRIINIYPNPHSTPYEREIIRANITQAFTQDLAAINQQRKVILAFDHWESTNRETQDWLWANLLEWTIYQVSPMILCVASRNPPEWYQNQAEIACLVLEELPEEAVRLYWTVKRKLPVANLANNLPMYGFPSLLVMAADELSRHIQQGCY